MYSSHCCPAGVVRSQNTDHPWRSSARGMIERELRFEDGELGMPGTTTRWTVSATLKRGAHPVLIAPAHGMRILP